MLSVLNRTASENDRIGTPLRRQIRRPATISASIVTSVNTSLTSTCAVRMVCGRIGVARRRFRMPPSR